MLTHVILQYNVTKIGLEQLTTGSHSRVEAFRGQQHTNALVLFSLTKEFFCGSYIGKEIRRRKFASWCESRHMHHRFLIYDMHGKRSELRKSQRRKPKRAPKTP